jgi:hypothetical protein
MNKVLTEQLRKAIETATLLVKMLGHKTPVKQKLDTEQKQPFNNHTKWEANLDPNGC